MSGRSVRGGRGLGVVAVVVAALACAPSGALALGRAGDLDPTFNGGAPVALQFARSAPADTFLQSLIVDPAGRLLVAGGSIDDNGKNAGVVARLSGQGVLDPAFGQGGSRILQLGQGAGTYRPYSFVSSLFVGPGGRVGVSVYRFRADDRRDQSAFALLDDGSPDLGFGSAGLATFDPATAPAEASTSAATAGPDGSVYVAGTLDPTPSTGANRKLAITKFSNTGQVVPGFGNSAGSYVGSFSQSPTDTGTSPSRIYPLANGKLLVVGYARTTDDRAGVLLARFSAASGYPDTSFGQKPGYTLIQARDTGGSDSMGAAVAIGADNSIYVAGGADDAQGDQAMLVMKLTPSGEPDYQFGSNGIKRFQTATGTGSYRGSSAQAVVLQPDGRILLIGTTRDGPDEGGGVVLRLMPNGSLDPSFGANGVLRLALAGQGGLRRFTFAYDGSIVDGRLVLAGSIVDTTGRGFVARVLLDALPDPAPPVVPAGAGGGGAPPVAVAGPVAGAATGRLTVAQALTIDAKGRVHVPLTCSATGPCAGRLFVVADSGKVVVAAAAKPRRAATYASASYQLAAGAKRTLVLQLRTKGRRALRGHRTLKARLVLAPTGQTSSTSKVTLVASHRR
jgi:uncharacterized delta-60 repeat protein